MTTTATTPVRHPLREGQQAAMRAITSFLANDAEPVFVLKGYSGTGKSTLVDHLIRELPKLQKMIKLVNPKAPELELCLTATTNKAAENLASITNQEVRTVQSFLGLTVQTNYTTRETKLVIRKYEQKRQKLLLIDEASYIDPALLKYIFELVKDSKIIFIGDPAQLTQVKATNTPVFCAGFPGAELTEVVRAKFEDGTEDRIHPITELATNFRNTVNTGEWFSFNPDGNHIQYLERENFYQAILDEFTRPDWKSKDSKVLAWTNKRVLDYNNAIRSHCKGTANFQVGDYVVCNKYFGINKQTIKTDETVLITHISEPTHQFGVPGRFYTVENRVKAFCPDDVEHKANRIKQAKGEEDYSTLEKIDTEWIDLRSMYACTINKSQGSTYDRVFIDLDDIKRCNSGNQIARMLYVGVSRARHQVFLTGDIC